MDGFENSKNWFCLRWKHLLGFGLGVGITILAYGLKQTPNVIPGSRTIEYLNAQGNMCLHIIGVSGMIQVPLQHITLCKSGLQEVYRDVNGTRESRLYCCLPKSEDATAAYEEATKCRLSQCRTSVSPNHCVTLPTRFINNGTKQLKYEEILQQPCSLSSAQGVVGLCCLKNSTDSLLASMLGAEPNEFPHQAKLQGCGGTVYNKNYVITAAHCVVNLETGEVEETDGMEVVLGSNIADTEGKEYIYGVKNLIVHPQSSFLKGSHEQESTDPVFLNDIALLELDREIQFGDNVKALEIAPKGFNPLKYADKAVIVGWGTTWIGDLLPPRVPAHLQKTNFLIRRDQSCFTNSMGPHSKYIWNEDQLLCVGGILEGSSSPNAGSGDSGGPAICRGADGKALLCGITSFGGTTDADCAANPTEKGCPPSVYAEVAYFHDWIKKEAGDQDPNTLYKPFVYGEVIPLDQHEHQVHITTSEGDCGGTLIAPDVVITAADCVAAKPGEYFSNLTVTTGLNEVTGQGQTIGVKSLTLLPYLDEVGGELSNSTVLTSDELDITGLAVIKLSQNVSQPKIFPKLPERGYQPQMTIGVEMAFPLNTTYSAQMSQRRIRFLDLGECIVRMNRRTRGDFDNVIVEENDASILCGVEIYSGGSTCDRELGEGFYAKEKTETPFYVVFKLFDGVNFPCQIFLLMYLRIPVEFVRSL